MADSHRVNVVEYSLSPWSLPTETFSVTVPYWFKMGGTQYARSEFAMTPLVLELPNWQVMLLLELKHGPDIAISLPPRLFVASLLSWR